jgi:ankyrin repeat protein
LKNVLLADKFNENQAAQLIKKINKNHKFENGDTLLDLCLRMNKFKAASWLLKQGIEITNRNKDNVSSVRLAVEKGNLKVVNDIFEYGHFNINQKDLNGRSLLQDAVIYGNKDIAAKLIQNDIDVNIIDNRNRNVAFDAVSYGDSEVVDTVLESKDLELNHKDNEGKTILHLNSVLENDNIAEKLLVKGADPTICDPKGYSFLTHTALRGQEGEKLLDVAINHGCDLNAKVADENSVLMEVMFAFSRLSEGEKQRRSELKNVASKLIDKGSDVSAINKFGETILFDMVRRNDTEGVAFSLEHKVDVNHINNNGETALQIAMLRGVKNLDLILLLLQYKADPTIRNKFEQTIPELLNEVILHVHNHRPLIHKEYLAYIDKEGKYMLLLKEVLALKDYDYSYFDSLGNPLFFIPFIYGDMQTTKLYSQYGLDINVKNSQGHNLFYEYVLRAFQEGKYFHEFRANLVYLLQNKANVNSTNKHGQSIYSKVALIPNCNLKLFRKLIEVTRHDYTSIDNMGRTIMHSCVWSNNIELLKLVYGVERNIQNIPDNYNILPITYAALFGKFEIVNEFLRKDAIITSGLAITKAIKEKFRPLVTNLNNLIEKIDPEDKDLIRKFGILKEQIEKDFKL